jgi:hypothetical protein
MTANTVVTNSTGGYANVIVDKAHSEALLLNAMLTRTKNEMEDYVNNRTDPVLLEFLQHLIRNHPMFKAEFAAFMARKKMGIDSV